MSNIKKKFGLLVLWWLRFCSTIQLKKNKNATIIGITGSAGKTSARQAVYTVLRPHFKTKVTGKANSESGLPLDILGIHIHDYSAMDWLRVCLLAPLRLFTNWEKFDKYVVEMGIDEPHEPKNMTYLLKIIRPNIGIFLNARAVHAEQFDYLAKSTDPEERRNEIIDIIAKEKGKLITSLPSKGFAILNIDDKRVADFTVQTRAKTITVGQNGDISIVSSKSTLKGYELNFAYEKKKYKLFIKNHVFPSQFSSTFAVAIATGLANNVSIEKSITSLENYNPEPGRSSFISGKNKSFIIDSSYNASADTMIESINLAKEIAGNSRIIFALGDMRELGQESAIEHKRVASLAAKYGNVFYLVGPEMQKYFIPELIKQKVDEKDIHWFANSHLASNSIQNEIKENDVILVKGSQNTIFMERIVESIMENPEQASKLLCRQGEYWEKIRSKYI